MQRRRACFVQDREAGSQQENTHQGEGLGLLACNLLKFLFEFWRTHDQGQSSSTLGINKEQGRNGEHDLDCAITK